MKQDADRGWRRVVPSPKPRKAIEAGVIKSLVKNGVVVIAGGWYAVVACLMGLAGPRRWYRRLKKALAYATGMVFIALGLRLAGER